MHKNEALAMNFAEVSPVGHPFIKGKAMTT
jgi:hypothetical protein